jgi:hypothetical protein
MLNLTLPLLAPPPNREPVALDRHLPESTTR